MADEAKTATAGEAQAAQPAQAQAPQFTVDASALLSTYTNWYRVTGTLPACPAGEAVARRCGLSPGAELLHLPGKPAGVVPEERSTPLAGRTPSPAGQAGRGRTTGSLFLH